MTREETFDLLEKHNQHRIIRHYRRLSPDKRDLFWKNLRGLDFPLVFNLHQKFAGQKKPARRFSVIQPASVIPVSKTLPGTTLEKKARLEGEALLKKNRVAVLIVAGGQGSRFGSDGPKGFIPVSPVRKKSLFQLLAETVSAVSLRYRASLPLLIMTSPENDRPTRDFFQANAFFGLNAGSVYFLTQEMLPTITADGNLILRDETHLFANPDGHGGSLKALHKSGVLAALVQKGFTELFYCQVDNPLVKIADPVFLGCHRMAKSEFSLKVLRRRDAAEKIGVYALLDGKPGVIEYSDLAAAPEAHSPPAREKEEVRYWAGSIAIHILSLPFIQRLNRHGFSLPYHQAVKAVKIPDRPGAPEEATAWKFETFVFDGLPLARRTCCLETLREEEFAPVKNRSGEDSVGTAEKAMADRSRRWLSGAGVKIAPGIQVEIDPHYALDEKELVRKLKRHPLAIKKDTLLE